MARLSLIALLLCPSPQEERLPGTEALAATGDLSAAMMSGLHRCVERKIAESVASRQKLWKRDPSSREAYEASVAENRKRFLKIIGVVDPRVPTRMERFGDDRAPVLVAETDKVRTWQVRWPVLDGVTGEGLLHEPKAEPLASVVALPDADLPPEELAWARRLAESGVRVLVPALISRAIDASGHPKVGYTNQTHREWIYRQAFHMGRHVIGYEVQKVMAAVDGFRAQRADAKVGVAGYGEGGLIAFYAAAADPRIDAALVSGYFDSRQKAWQEPLYRNVWSLLHEFGDAEIATLVAPRGLVVEASAGPKVDGPPPAPKGRRGGAAVGKLGTPERPVEEFARIGTLIPDGFQKRILAAEGTEALRGFLGMLGGGALAEGGMTPVERKGFDPSERQRRQVKELEEHVQRLIRGADRVRDDLFLNTTSLMKGLESRGQRFRMNEVATRPADVFAKEAEPRRKAFHEEFMGRIDEPLVAAAPKSRRVYDREKWTGWEVTLDVFPEVFAWGVLLLPKDLKPGERRPVVVCQHGRNGVPADVIEEGKPNYNAFAARLAERGFIVFAPHNPYRGEDLYRMLSRKANLVKASLFSFILAQHRQILDWLKTLPSVDPDRIGFYGLSYGGETAVRVPTILTDYALSICSGDFNDWARKVASTDSDYSFMFSIEWEMPYFDLGSTFNYAEMAHLMVPRPFMVERGHHDGVAPDEWVNSEYAKVRWLYAQLGLADRTEIEIFNGGHVIHLGKTFEFLHRHLRWPAR